MISQNYIGIRGDSTGESGVKLWIDDLPGIDIAAAANVTTATAIRPKDLVKKCFGLAVEQVWLDLLTLVGSDYEYKRVISDTDFQTAGNYALYGMVEENLIITIESNIIDRYLICNVSSLQIYSDRQIEKEFTIISDGISQSKTIALVPGLNTVIEDFRFNGRKLEVRFDVSNFNTGKSDGYAIEQSLSYCGAGACYDINHDSSKFGINVLLQCVANEAEIVKYILRDLHMPLLYRTGINYLLHAKASNNPNAYTRNSSEKIDALLLQWQGGKDPVTENYVKSEYWKALNSARNVAINNLPRISPYLFQKVGAQFINSLPG